MADKIILSPKILELNSESNDIYMTLNMVILTSNVNLNGARFTEDFIDGIVDNQSEYQGIPLVVNRVKLENEVYDSLGHEYKDGELNTDMIGSFVSFTKQKNDDESYSLIGEARVMKRFTKTCEAIVSLYEQDLLRFSCEAYVREYGEMTESTRDIPYASGRNQLVGNCIVTHPAEVSAKPTLLVASLDEDLNLNKSSKDDLDTRSQEGGQGMEFNKGYAIKHNGSIENCELSFDDISGQIYNSLNGEEYRFWIRETFPSYAIISSWEDDKLFQVGYSIADEVVTVDAQDNWIEVEMVYQPKGQMMAAEEEMNSLKTEIDNLKEQLTTKENEIAELQKGQVEVEEKNEAIIKLNSAIEDLKTQIASLQPIKEEYERVQAEIAEQARLEKVQTLKTFAINSKMITEKEISEDEQIKQMIEELNEVGIKSLIADRIVEKATLETTPPNPDVVINTSEPEDLLPQSAKEKMYAPRSK